MFKKGSGSDVESLSARIKGLESSRDHLKKEFVRLLADFDRLQMRQQATINFYEYRIDQIYHNILKRLPDADSKQSNDESFQRIEANPEWERLVFNAREKYLRPGLIKSPLTLSGFRIDTRRAIERLDHIEIVPGSDGIAVFGPYRKLQPGPYEIHFALCADAMQDVSIRVEAYTGYNALDRVISQSDFGGGQAGATLRFDWTFEFVDAEIEFRLHQRGRGGAKLKSIDVRQASR